MSSSLPSDLNCFVISPIGQPQSDTRLRSDALLSQVITPALSSMGYRVRRGDQIGAQWITPELVDEIRACVLVVVVLTELNPNVFFEMGAAQAWFKPMVVLAEVGTELPFDVKDLNTVFYTASESNGQLTDSAADDCMTTLKSLAEVAAAKVKLSPFYHGLCAISSHYSLSAIYSGKRFILEVFDAGVQDVIGAMEKDYELIDEGKPEGLRGLAPVLMEHSQVFHEQSRALHKTVRVADLPPSIGASCLKICSQMEQLCQSAMRLADRLTRKPVLETSDVKLARTGLSQIKTEIAECLTSIHLNKQRLS